MMKYGVYDLGAQIKVSLFSMGIRPCSKIALDNT